MDTANFKDGDILYHDIMDYQFIIEYQYKEYPGVNGLSYIAIRSKTYYSNIIYKNTDKGLLRYATGEEKAHFLACKVAGCYIEPIKQADYGFC